MQSFERSDMATKSKTVVVAAAAPVNHDHEEAEAELETIASAVAKNVREAAHFNVLQLGDLVQNRLGRVLREFDLTLSQYQALRVLEHAGTALPSLEIGVRMPQVTPAITGLLTRLEEQGLVKRKQDKQDKRVTQVELTTKGKGLLKKSEKAVLDLHKQLSAPLSDTELKQLSKLIEKAWRGALEPSKA